MYGYATMSQHVWIPVYQSYFTISERISVLRKLKEMTIFIKQEILTVKAYSLANSKV